MPTTCQFTIGLRHTDAAGLIFYPRLFELVQDTLEVAMHDAGVPVAERIHGDGPIVPIVHCEADFMRPLRLGDHVTVELRSERVGTSSFGLVFRVLNGAGEEAARARVVHTSLDRSTGRATPLTGEMRRFAEGLG